nr:unnamed protein product [Callosobruchus chinensis]
MLFIKTLTRSICTGKHSLAAEKSLLAALRKKTGYTFANCKKALEMHDNDLNRAELWLKSQAQALGWSKATKLEGRHTAQGLIGVAVNQYNGVMVEVNCETDFVAKNKEFQSMVEDATKCCLRYIESQQKPQENVAKFSLDSEQLKGLHSENDGKSLADKLALMIGTVGENATLKQGLGLKTCEGIHIVGYAHPSGHVENGLQLGKLGGLLAYRSLGEGCDHKEIAKGICQHIVGMRPTKIGTEDDKPSSNKDEEACLIHQEYLLDDSVTVKELLEQNQLEIVDFKRLECGETVSSVGKQPLEFVETCQ